MELTASGLVRSFGKHVAVADANVVLRPGTITGLVGPNGAGKTTLLLMLAGLLAPDSGHITVGGNSVRPDELRRITGWMPDVFGTWDSLTAAEVLSTFARLYGQSSADARTRSVELLDMVHLSEFGARPAHVLSRGQKQRLGFACALINRPRILLLDEPASGMDPRSRVDLRDHLRSVADSGCAVLVSSHILTELAEMVDGVVIMAGGRTQIPETVDGHRWRIRRAGQPVGSAEVRSFADEDEAAEHLGELIANGERIVEFARVAAELESSYLATNAERI